MDKVRALLRKTLDSAAPSLGRWYRKVRDDRAASAPVQTPYGFWLAVPPVATSGSAALEMASGTFETEAVDLFLSYLKTCGVCVDVGANIGFYSCLAASLGKHVVAFEPLASNVRYLLGNLSRNGYLGAEVFPIGLASKPGLQHIYGAGPGASLLPDWNDEDTSRSASALIPVSTLDIAVGGRFPKQMLAVKIDVEGIEFDVLSGAEQTLRLSPKPIWLVEIQLRRFATGVVNEHFYDTFESFWRNGYEARLARSNQQTVRPEDVSRWVANGSVDHGGYNYFFVPQ